MRKLNDKQKAFASEYVVDSNATQAAIRAGYSAKTAGQIAHKLLKKAQIQADIKQRRQTLQESVDITTQDVLAGFLTEARGEGPDTNANARNRAWELLARYLGMLVERKEVGRPGDFEQLPDDELEAKIAELSGNKVH